MDSFLFDSGKNDLFPKNALLADRWGPPIDQPNQSPKYLMKKTCEINAAIGQNDINSTAFFHFKGYNFLDWFIFPHRSYKVLDSPLTFIVLFVFLNHRY